MDQLALALAMKKVGEIPALSHVTTELLDLINDPASTSQDICNVIMKDPVVTYKVLRLVNSAYYGLPRRVGTISEAVTILGFETLRTLVLGVSVYRALGKITRHGLLDSEQIWKHSVATAAASKILAQELDFPRAEQAFVAGLLHDIGKVILNSLMRAQYAEVVRKINETELSLLRAEREVLEFDHAEIGKLVAEKWNLPGSLVEPIGFHHAPLLAENYKDLTYIIHLANAVVIVAGYGLGDDKDYHLDTKVLTQVGMSFDKLMGFSSEIGNVVTAEVLI